MPRQVNLKIGLSGFQPFDFKRVRSMLLSDFDFELPPELIAQTPVAQREQSRLMVVHRDSGQITHERFTSFPDFLEDNPLLVFNDTQVIPAKLVGKRNGSAKPIEFLLVHEVEPGVWEGLIPGLAKLKPGQEFEFENRTAVFRGQKGDHAVMEFSEPESFHSWLDAHGQVPLPPYIKRNPNHHDEALRALDRDRYQTIFSRHPGAIAAPTAGLHFTPEILKTVGDRAETAFLTLHVGPGTFQPVRVEKIEDHQMKKEPYRISAEVWNQIYKAKQERRSILAVGTTSTRVLESLDFENERKEELAGWTDCFLVPGHRFRNADQLLTNFHLPKSTLFMLVCAFAGKSLMEKAYKTAITEGYRFFSYGDAMLIL